MVDKVKVDKRKIWLVPHPTHQFKEDVKELAAMNRLKIVDAKYADQYPAKMIATKTPNLTSLKAIAEEEAKQAALDAAEAEAAAEIAELERKARLEIEVRARVEAEHAAKNKKK